MPCTWGDNHVCVVAIRGLVPCQVQRSGHPRAPACRQHRSNPTATTAADTHTGAQRQSSRPPGAGAAETAANGSSVPLHWRAG